MIKQLKQFLDEEYTLLVLLLLLGTVAAHLLARHLPAERFPTHLHHATGADFTRKPT
jgi:hypothetical protein